MEKKIFINPLNKIFKQNPSDTLSLEIENPSNIPLLFDFLKDNDNSINNKIEIISQLTSMINEQRAICAFLPKYENKSIYIFFFELYLQEKESLEYKQAIRYLLYEFSGNIEISKEIYEYIFQKLSLAYRQDKTFLSQINYSPKLFNDYFFDLLNLLYSTFENINKNKMQPRNYFACSGNCNFSLNFNQNNFILGKCLSFIINFKILKSKIMKENPEVLGKCNLIKIYFKDDNKVLDIQLKYPFFVIIKEQKNEYIAKVCPLDEWINLTITIVPNDSILKVYFFINGENSLLPIKIKNLKLKNNDIMNSIVFFDNFYGEVTSISMLSLNHNDSLNIFSQTLKYFSELNTGLWKKRYLNNFINFLQGIILSEKKDDGGEKENLSQKIVFIFTPFNYDKNRTNIVEDYLEKYDLIINGNIINHKYRKFQKNIEQICNINSFLPIFEMLLIYQKELLSEKNLILILKIIFKLICKKNLIYMNKTNFFQLLSLFIEKLPNNIFNEKILKEFENIGKKIMDNKIKNFCSNFFNDILLNEKIIFKFNQELQIKLWNIILNLCISDKGKIDSFINMKKINALLKYYDRNRYSEICCKFHLNMYKKEFIGDMKVMSPSLNERIIYIQKILDVIILNENPEKIISLYKLLMLDLSPCLMKFILKIFITGLDYKNKNEEWKNKLVLEIIKSKYEIITINAFSHSLPDVRYEILILMNYIFMRLIKLNKIAEFGTFEKMVKTCFLPQDIFYMEIEKKKENNLDEQLDFDALAEFQKNQNKNSNTNNNIKDDDDINNNINISELTDKNNKKEKDKSNQDESINKNIENKDNSNPNESNNKNIEKKEPFPLPIRGSKSNSIYILASKFDNKNKKSDDKKLIKNVKTILGGKTKMLINKFEEKLSTQNKNNNQKNPNDNSNIKMNVVNNNKNQQNNRNDEENKIKIIRASTVSNLKKKDETNIDYIDFKEGQSIYNKKRENQTLIFRDELYDIYINSLYILFLKWTLGIPIAYTSSSSSELFSSLKQQKDISSKNYFITNINIIEFIFVLNNNLNNIDFTYRCLKNFERLILLPENSYIILSNKKIFSYLLDISYNYYKIIKEKKDKSTEMEKEILKIGKNNLVCILINSMNLLNDEKNDPSMEQLEIIFLWGEKIILSAINDTEILNSVLDFIYQLFLDILYQFEKDFGDIIKKEFNFDFNPMDLKTNFILRNFLTYITSVYNFCFHYKVDPIIKNSDMDAFFSVSLNINIPEIFISGMRMDNTKGNNISEYWKDFHLIETILNKINYVFKSEYIKKKVFGKNYKKGNPKQKLENENNQPELKYDKYNSILNELILNKDKKDLFKKELFLLCYYETTPDKIEAIIPLIRILSISLICILSIAKDINDEEQFKHWLKIYKNLLKFTILSSTNLSKNPNSTNDIKIYNKIQGICFDVISAGLCFLNNILECSIICQNIIRKYISDIFLLCFSILKLFFDALKNKKLFSNKLQIDFSTSAVLILFNDYIKDKNNNIFINAIKLEKVYLNPEFKLYELINENAFYENFFENKNIKIQLFKKYYSINTYKIIVDKRYKLIRTLDENVDYSYQINIFELFPLYEKELLKYINNSIKNNKKRKNLYFKQKKKLFSWNGLWSNRDLFYGENGLKNKIKYKLVNHYTKSLMRPLISPILDINYYLPEFTQYNKEKLFIKNNNNDNGKESYDLIMDFDQMLKKSNDNIFNKNVKTKDLNIKNNIIEEDNNNININVNGYIDENIKRVSRLLKIDKNESKNNYLKYIYQKSNPKFNEYFKKISAILSELGEEEQIENISKNDLENEDNDFIKQSERKDTVQTQRTSSSTIKKEIPGNSSSFKNNYVNLIYDKESNKLKNEEILNNKEYFPCCLVKQSHHVKGLVYMREKKLNFKILQLSNTEVFSEKDDDYDKERNTCFGSYFNHHPKDKNLYKKSIIFNDIKWVLKRKYFYKNSAIEIFTIKNKSYYFNFKDEETRNIIITEIIKKIGNCVMIINDIKEIPNNSYPKGNINPNIIIGYQNNDNPLIAKKCKFKFKKKIKLSKIIVQWQNWEFSNFELIILLNIFSNRSYNDINQYPVFPWLLTNYSDPLKTQQLKDKENENDENKIIEDYTYRDLSIPMGMLTINEESIKRKKNYLSTYKIFKQEEGMKPYIFGCNYSNATYVCNYLIRLFPFSQVCIEIQGEGFDAPRRLFTSIEKAFKNASTHSTDVREIIPEFFYFPEIFQNLNCLNMGTIDENTLVDKVNTPCGDNPYKFIVEMKNILENEYISHNINNWIDLIFGYKAKGKEAENAKNIFTKQSYQEDININDIEDKDNYLRYVEFGLIPNQLFNAKEFPKKEEIEEIKKFKQITDNTYNIKKYRCKKSTNNSIKFKGDTLLLSMINISQEKIILFYNTNYYVEEKISYSIFEKEYHEEIIEIKKITPTLNKISSYCLPKMNNSYNNKNIKIIREGKIIIMGGYYDGKIVIIDIDENSMTEIIPFKDESPINIIHVDKDEQFLFLGNILGNIVIMSIDNKNIKEWRLIYLINDQLNSISFIHSNNELNIWSSASIDGFVNIYTLPLNKLTKSFKVPNDNNICNFIYVCDSPLNSIIIIFDKEIYLYSINGFKINLHKEENNIINPIVMKDFFKNDYLAYIINNKEIYILNVGDFSVQTKIKNDSDIYYLYSGNDLKVLYAINKNGTVIDIFICDTKKVLIEEEK